MESTDIKSVLIQRIQDIDDSGFLNALKVLTDAKAQEVYQLSALEREHVLEARQQHAEGRVTSHEMVKQELEAWLKNE